MKPLHGDRFTNLEKRIVNRYFKNDEDAKSLIQEIEQIIDVKFPSEKNRLASKEDAKP